MIEQILILFSFVALNLYLLGAFQTGVPKSISDSSYIRKKPWKLTFELTCWFSGLSLSYIGYKLDNSILFISGLGFILVGLFSDFKRNRLFSFMHYSGAIVGFSGLGLSFLFDWWWWTIIYAVVGTIFSYGIIWKKYKDNWLTYFEISLIYCGFIGLIIYNMLKL